MFKKIFLFFTIFILTLSFLGLSKPQHAYAEEAKTVNVYFFWGKGCPHCADEKPFLEKMKNKYPQIQIVDYEVWGNQENLNLMQEAAKKLNAKSSGVPLTIIGKNYVAGWLNEEISGKKIEDAINCAIETNCPDILKDANTGEKQQTAENAGDNIKSLKIPFFGEINLKGFSLPALTIILGLVDGFNPCAMWTLIFLISLLLGMNDQKRMWILGCAFIIASASVYFLFMSAWLNLILFLGFVIWIRIIIGLVALVAGAYNLKEYREQKDGVCKVTADSKRQKIFDKLRTLTHERNFWLALGGIILLAFAVNLVEAICSAGIPAVYTQILTLNHLPTWQYYGYILLYIFFFMLDDLIVFAIAMITLKMTGITSKYSRYSHLVGGLIMVIIGLLLLFKPEWLMFG